MSADTLEQQFVQWWPYPVPPNKQSITWAVAWAEHVLATRDSRSTPPTEDAVACVSRALLEQLNGSVFSSPEDYARHVLNELADLLESAGQPLAARALRKAEPSPQPEAA